MHRVVLCLAYSLTPRGATSVNRVALIFCRIPVESRAAVNGTVSDAGNVLLPIALCSAMSGVYVAAASDVHEFDPSRRHVGKPWCPDFCKIPVESRAAGNGTVSDAGNVLLPIALCSAMSGVYVAAVPSDVHEFDPSRRHIGAWIFAEIMWRLVPLSTVPGSLARRTRTCSASTTSPLNRWKHCRSVSAGVAWCQSTCRRACRTVTLLVVCSLAVYSLCKSTFRCGGCRSLFWLKCCGCSVGRPARCHGERFR